MLNLIDDPFINGLKQMSSSDVEFLGGSELKSMFQPEELSKGDNVSVAKAMEGQAPLENLDLVLTLLRVADSELLRKDGMKGMTCFNSRLFDRSTVVTIFDSFENLLEMAVENPHKVVWELPMLTHVEQQRQLVEWNKTSAPYPTPGWLVHEFFLDQAEANPNAIALVEYGGLKRIISYEQLRSMAEKVARQMRVMGVEGDPTVGLLMTNDSAEAIASIYGVLMAGGAYVPLDPGYPAARVKLIVEDAELKALLVEDEDAFAERRNVVKCPLLSVTNILNDSLLPEQCAMDCLPPACNTSCYVMYTSGTTGKPKGVVLEHANISCFVQYGALHVSKGLGPGNRFLNSSPMTFDMSSNIQFSTLSMGATLVLASKSMLLGELELLVNTVRVS